jgi:hypothetical protein
MTSALAGASPNSTAVSTAASSPPGPCPPIPTAQVTAHGIQAAAHTALDHATRENRGLLLSEVGN